MPFVDSVAIEAPERFQQPAHVGSDIQVKVTAAIEFHERELELGLPHFVHIYLLEKDRTKDIYSPQPNWKEINMQWGGRSDHDLDELLGKKRLSIRADASPQMVSTIFHDLFPTLESDRRFEFMAFVVCVPVSGAAMKWSRVARTQVVIA